MIVVFVLGYLAITLEHSLKVDKLVPALVMMAISWAIIALNFDTFTSWFSPAIHGLVEGFGGLDIDALPALPTAIEGTDLFVTERTGTNYKVSADELKG